MMAAGALLLGLCLALIFGNPYRAETRKVTPWLLKACVIGLGAGMDLSVILQVGWRGIGYTLVGITGTLLLGLWLGKCLRTSRNIALLISVGTAICGGSAIAAVSPVIEAKSEEVSLALITVFLLNAVALFLFPLLGHQFILSEEQFGLWAALSIHDTSSVVGAAMQYGALSLQVATTIKLTRTLWILPVTILCAKVFQPKSAVKMKFPLFILGFLAMAAFFTLLPDLRGVGEDISLMARYGLVLTLFLIGAEISRDTFKQVGWRPLVLGISLWFVTAALTLMAIMQGWVR